MRFYYKVKDKEIEIFRCHGSGSRVEIPAYINGLPVTRAAGYAFSDRKAKKDANILVWESEGQFMSEDSGQPLWGPKIEEIIFPDTIREIGNYIFYGCKNLRHLEFSDSLMHIGSGAFTGCGNLSALTVYMKNGLRSCVKEILGELWQRIDVTFCFQNGGCAYLVFPEHYEEAVENTPARILFTQHHGSGNNYRQCFYNKELDYRKYDSLFSVAAAWDKPKVLADIAFSRLKYPYHLAGAHREAYISMIQKRYEEILEYVIEEDRLDYIKVISGQVFWTPDMIEYALEATAESGKTEILSYLMNEKQKFTPKKKKLFQL